MPTANEIVCYAFHGTNGKGTAPMRVDTEKLRELRKARLARRAAESAPRRTLTEKVYVAVRRAADDAHEWLDLATVSGLLEYTQSKAATGNANCVSWAEANPVVRYAAATLTELDQ